MKKLKMYFKIHYSFIIMMILSFVFGMHFLFLMHFVCIVLHELCHSFVARRLGYKIGRINLAFTGAVLEAELDEFKPSDEIKIAIAGPLFNLCFAFLIVSFWWIIPESYNFTLDLCVINIVIFAYNLLPIFPLDGGRILLAIFCRKIERKQAYKIVKIIAITFSGLLFVMFIISLFFSPAFSLAIASVNLLASGFEEDKLASYKRVYFLPRKISALNKRGLEKRIIMVGSDCDLYALFKMIDARHFTEFIYVDENFKEVRRLSENDVVKLLQS